MAETGTTVLYEKSIEYTHPTQPEAVSEPVATYETRDDIEALIRATFPEEPERAVRVAWCESRFKPDAYNPKNNSHDGGIFQISLRWHGAELAERGLDRFDIEDNIAFSRILYDRNGWQDWSASEHCWRI